MSKTATIILAAYAVATLIGIVLIGTGVWS